jgi:endonuclease/exonuclease/phosphatase family metal-dependent hydrolase
VLTVFTLNLWHTKGAYRERARLVRAWIERLAPDLIAFQEAVRGDGFDQPAALLEGLGYATAFAGNMPLPREPGLVIGNALASRWPIVDQTVVDLPNACRPHHRRALSATVAVSGVSVAITSVHLSPGPRNSDLRAAQAAAVGQFAQARWRDGTVPILLGDFNAPPDDAAIRRITEGPAPADAPRFVDAWLRAGDGGPGVTWPSPVAAGAAAHPHARRIDYIFVGLSPHDGGAIVSCRRVCDDAPHGVYPSDHVGLFAELRLPHRCQALDKRDRRKATRAT